MQPGRTLGVMAVCVGSLLATLTAVYAAHFVAGGGIYSLTSDGSETSVRFQFLGIKSSLSEVFVPVIQTQIQCRIVHTGASMSFRLFTSGTELDPFVVKKLDPPEEFPRRVTLTGTMHSHLVWREGAERQQFTETAPFQAVGVDVAIPGVGRDRFTLRIHYRARRDIGPLLFEALGAELVTCNANTCTLTVTGTLTDGEIEAHTAAGP
jgi:hypothetical protein